MAGSFLAYKPSPYRKMGRYKLGQLQIKGRKLKAFGLDFGYNYVKIRQKLQGYPNQMLDCMYYDSMQNYRY